MTNQTLNSLGELLNYAVQTILYLFTDLITADSGTFAIARTKTTVVVNLISHKQLCRNSLHSTQGGFYGSQSVAQVPEFAVSPKEQITLHYTYHPPQTILC